MKKKLLLVALCIMLVSSSSVWAADWNGTPSEEVITPFMTYIRKSNAYLRVSPYGHAEIECYVRGSSEVSSVEICAELQQLQNGRWRTVETFTAESSSSRVSLYESCSVSEGYAYRVRATMRAYSGSSSERDIVFSDTVMY